MNFKEPAQALEWMSPALLLSPAELAAELATARNAPALARHALHLELAEAELAALESPLLPQGARFALFVHDSGLPVVLLVVQFAGIQFRFLVPIVGARQRVWIQECVKEGDVLLTVDAPQTKQFALVNVLLNLRDDGPQLLRHCESAAQPTRDELVSVMATLVGALQPPHRVTSSVSGIAVARARVFVTLPVAGDVPPHGAGVLAPGSLH
jgi:hypothetical protein